MWNVALEVPLRALALGRGGQRHRPADARVKPLRDPLDGPALASRVASLEDDDQLELLGHHPVLELDQLALQAEQLLEIKPPRQRVVRLKMFGLRQEVGELIVLEFELDVLVQIVLYLGVDALLESAGRPSFICARSTRVHCRRPHVRARAATKRGDRSEMFDDGSDSFATPQARWAKGAGPKAQRPAFFRGGRRFRAQPVRVPPARRARDERQETVAQSWRGALNSSGSGRMARASDEFSPFGRFQAIAGCGVPLSRRPWDAWAERAGRARRYRQRGRLSCRRRRLQGQAGGQVSVHGSVDARQAPRGLRGGDRRQPGLGAANLSVGSADYPTRG